MFFEFMRFARILKPKYLFLENVKGLLNHENGETFKTILSTLDELGYDAEWQVFNSKDFGVPQNRERVFIIGHLRGECTRKIFPLERAGGKNPNKLKEITSGVSQGYRIYDASGVSTALASQAGGLGAKTGLYAVYLDKPFGEGSCSKYYIKREVSIASCLAAGEFSLKCVIFYYQNIFTHNYLISLKLIFHCKIFPFLININISFIFIAIISNFIIHSI